MSTAFELSCLACLLSCSCKHYNLVLMYVFSSAINCTYILYLFIIDCFYIALFSAFKQTHCARMWFYIQPCTMSLHESHIRKMYACSAVTCHLHFWQNDQGLLCATAVTWGWNAYQDKWNICWWACPQHQNLRHQVWPVETLAASKLSFKVWRHPEWWVHVASWMVSACGSLNGQCR